MRGLFFAIAACVLAALPAHAETYSITTEVTKRTVIVRVAPQELWRQLPTVAADGKLLPAGYHDFIPVSPRVIMSHDLGVVCDDWRKAISFVQRLSEGFDDYDAMVAVNYANRQPRCGVFRENVRLQILDVAIRGGSDNLKVRLLRLLGPGKKIYYFGLPLSQ